MTEDELRYERIACAAQEILSCLQIGAGIPAVMIEELEAALEDRPGMMQDA